MRGKTGNPVDNQFVIETKKGTYFQSYRSVVAKVAWECIGMENTMDVNGNPLKVPKVGKVLTLGRDWDYSRTTMKYLHQFLEENLPKHNVSPDVLRKRIDTKEVRYNENLSEEV